jgi:hypothetical protein
VEKDYVKKSRTGEKMTFFDIELINCETELRILKDYVKKSRTGEKMKDNLEILKECIEQYFDMPKDSILWRDFYRYYKARLEGKE